MKRLIITLGALLLSMAMVTGPALAEGKAPVRHAPSLVDFSHSHHVHTGNGGCVDIASVFFVPAANGLHQGSNASMGPERGPFHGTCIGELYPDGPLLSDLNIPPHH